MHALLKHYIHAVDSLTEAIPLKATGAIVAGAGLHSSKLHRQLDTYIITYSKSPQQQILKQETLYS